MSRLAQLVAAAGFSELTPVALAVVTPAGQLDTAVSGAWREGRPVVPEDRFYAASLAKQLTGAAAALLVRDGRLEPDKPISTWLDGLPAWSHRITARQLAHHAAGLPEAAIAGNWTDEAVSAYLAELEQLPYLPGTAYHYSNLGYILLARVVAAASGMPFGDFVDSHLLGWPGIGFTSRPGEFPHAARLGPSLPLTQGDGGLWTTAPAFAAWLARQNHDPLGIASLVEAPGRLNDGSSIDYGWGLGIREYHGKPLLLHGGSWAGASARGMRCPALGIAVVALSASDDMSKLIELTDAALDLAAAER